MLPVIPSDGSVYLLVYIIGHNAIYCMDFGEFTIVFFFLQGNTDTDTHANSYTFQPRESNFKKYDSV